MEFNFKSNFINQLLSKYVNIRTSIYDRVVFIIIILSFILFFSFGAIFRSVNEDYMKNMIHQRGTNAAIMVKSALYQSMLENDKKSLQNTHNPPCFSDSAIFLSLSFLHSERALSSLRAFRSAHYYPMPIRPV